MIGSGGASFGNEFLQDQDAPGAKPAAPAPTGQMAAPWADLGGEDEAALALSQAQLQVLTDAMPQMVWSTRPDGFHDYYNARWYEFTGVPPGSTDGEGWNGMFHPDDQEKAWARWRHSLATGEPYEIEYRLKHRSGLYRWTLGRALPVRNEAGEIIRWIGTCTDIDAAKTAAEQNELLSRELSHRIKNIFAVITGLIGLSSRHAPALRPLAQTLQHRIAALGRAHEFARPHSEHSQPVLGASTLKGLLAEIFKPYPAFDEGRLEIAGDDTPIDDRGATPIALIFHELATNAAKYGALSTPEGDVMIEIEAGPQDIAVRWREAGGPRLAGPPDRTGFGTRLAEMSVGQQLGGRIERDWRPEGLALTIHVQADRLCRDL
jgi:PAS domain S-box-containing protein